MTMTSRVPKFVRMTPILTVSNMERSIAFYTGVLGFELVQRVEKDGETCFAILWSGGVEWMLQSRSATPSETAATVACYVDVTDVSALYDTVKHGAEILQPLERAAHGLLEFYIRDPDGYSIGFSQPE